MKNKKKSAFRIRRIWPLELLVGAVLMCIVFVLATNADIKRTEEMLEKNVNYIKEQCSNYNRLNCASETRSMLRMIESARQVKKNLEYEKNVTGQDLPDEEFMKTTARDNYVTGIILLDAEGNLETEYITDQMGARGLQKELENESLLDVAGFPEKSYGVRKICEDGSFVDIGACANADGTGIIVTYYHTPEEYLSRFSLSFDMLLSGYSTKDDGTIVITRGDRVIASNEESLVGANVDAIAVLRRIKESVGSGTLLHAAGDNGTVERNFGLIERGRDYYVYAYLPERSVFTTTIRNLVYTMVLYIFAIAVLHMVRWKTAQSYQREQMRMQEQYAEELQNKNAQLEQAVQRETKANAAKTNFLSRMTHDIRTPLNGIIGLLKIDEAHAEDTELVNTNREKMLISANHLLSLINDMLQMSKLEDNEVELAHEAMDLKELTKEIVTIVDQRAAEAGVTMEYEQKQDQMAYPFVYGSPLHVRQLFLNIYGNGIKYNKVGGKVQTSFSYLGMKDGIVTYRWKIADTGIGMSQDFLSHIFEPFAQEHSDARSVYQGTGLGMAIVKNLVDKMNGTIEVSSEEGVGSTFVITLPFEVADEKDAVKKENPGEKASIEGLHFLLAEDNALNAEIAEMLFQDEGATVTLAKNGQEAIDQFKDHPMGTFDAILMDIMMPLVDGFTATETIREMTRPDAKEIPIIAMTANAFAEDAKRCIEAGMNAHLSKPLQMDQVITTIAKYCK